MSSIKFVYQKKVHKVPPNQTSYSVIVNTIKTVYPQLQQMYLFAIVNPDNTDGVAEINSDVSFQQLRHHYTSFGWPSIKLLVTETQDCSQVLKDSWGLLNQSLIQVEKKHADASTFFQPQKADHSQQIIPQVDNRGTQAKIQQVDNAQNTQNDKLRDFIISVLDERLQYYGLLQKQPQKIVPLLQDFQDQENKIDRLVNIFPTKTREWMQKYVEQYGLTKSEDEIVEMLLLQEY